MGPKELITVDRLVPVPLQYRSVLVRFVQASLADSGYTLRDADAIAKVFAHIPAPRVDVEQIIQALKMACEVIAFLDQSVCPIVQSLP